MTTVAKPQFKTSTESPALPNTVKNVGKLDAYLVEYVDGEGKTQVRIALAMPNQGAVFLLQERIQGVNVATESTPWFKKAFLNKVAGAKEVESL